MTLEVCVPCLQRKRVECAAKRVKHRLRLTTAQTKSPRVLLPDKLLNDIASRSLPAGPHLIHRLVEDYALYFLFSLVDRSLWPAAAALTRAAFLFTAVAF